MGILGIPAIAAVDGGLVMYVLYRMLMKGFSSHTALEALAACHARMLTSTQWPGCPVYQCTARVVGHSLSGGALAEPAVGRSAQSASPTLRKPPGASVPLHWSPVSSNTAVFSRRNCWQPWESWPANPPSRPDAPAPALTRL